MHAPPSVATIGPGIIAAAGALTGGGGEGEQASCGSLLSSEAVKTEMPGAGGRGGGIGDTKQHLCPQPSDCQAAHTVDASSASTFGRCQVHTPDKGRESEVPCRARTKGPDARVSLRRSGWRWAGRGTPHGSGRRAGCSWPLTGGTCSDFNTFAKKTFSWAAYEALLFLI